MCHFIFCSLVNNQKSLQCELTLCVFECSACCISWHVLCKFDNVSSATQAKNSLNGQDIYSGCCTIKAEYAKVCPVQWCAPFSLLVQTCKLSFLTKVNPMCPQISGDKCRLGHEASQEISRHINIVTDDSRETTFLCQRLSMALLNGNTVSFQHIMITK